MMFGVNTKSDPTNPLQLFTCAVKTFFSSHDMVSLYEGTVSLYEGTQVVHWNSVKDEKTI